MTVWEALFNYYFELEIAELFLKSVSEILVPQEDDRHIEEKVEKEIVSEVLSYFISPIGRRFLERTEGCAIDAAILPVLVKMGRIPGGRCGSGIKGINPFFNLRQKTVRIT